MTDEPVNPFHPEEIREPDLFRYTGFEHWEYKPIIYKSEHQQSWRSMTESFYRASEFLVKAVVGREANEDIEGVAAVYLFRHHLELVLKGIVLHGRWIKPTGENAARDEVQKVKNIHELTILWQWVLEDAKPKIDPGHWENYHTEFVEHCIAEFDAVHQKGLAFRYSGLGGECCLFDFPTLLKQMEHIQQVLGGIEIYLIETYAQNEEYEAYLESEFRSDMY
jgi:hypothetical protein